MRISRSTYFVTCARAQGFKPDPALGCGPVSSGPCLQGLPSRQKHVPCAAKLLTTTRDVLTFSPRSMNCGTGTETVSPGGGTCGRAWRRRCLRQRSWALRQPHLAIKCHKAHTLVATCCPDALSNASSTKPNVPLLRSRICAGDTSPLPFVWLDAFGSSPAARAQILPVTDASTHEVAFLFTARPHLLILGVVKERVH